MFSFSVSLFSDSCSENGVTSFRTQRLFRTVLRKQPVDDGRCDERDEHDQRAGLREDPREGQDVSGPAVRPARIGAWIKTHSTGEVDNVQLTQKERSLLQDQLKHEEVCVQKYRKYAGQANDPQLRQLFDQLAAQEEEHHGTINQMLQGHVPLMGGIQANQQVTQQSGPATRMMSGGVGNATGSGGANQDAQLCSDMLMTEKYVSGAYDTSVFEFTDHDARQALNHIQGEEQQHGEAIFNYMSQNGMYNPQ